MRAVRFLALLAGNVVVPGLLVAAVMHVLTVAIGVDEWTVDDVADSVYAGLCGAGVAAWWRERTGRDRLAERVGNARYVEGFRDGHDVSRFRR